MRKRTDAYVMTVTSRDDPKLIELRDEIKKLNATRKRLKLDLKDYRGVYDGDQRIGALPTMRESYRVSVMGRIKNRRDPAKIEKMRKALTESDSLWKHTLATGDDATILRVFHQSVPLDIADHFDVYVHTQRREIKHKGVEYDHRARRFNIIPEPVVPTFVLRPWEKKIVEKLKVENAGAI